MADEKDRLGDTLRDKEKGDEDRFFAERDKAAIEKIRQKLSAAEIQQIREFARMRCPKCSERLASVAHHGVTVDECPSGHGTWLDQGELETLASRERDSWLGRFFHRTKR